MRTSPLVRLVALVAVLSALMLAAVWGQLSARLTGTEYHLRVTTADPMDPFRGAYVQLQYIDLPDLSTAPLSDGVINDDNRDVYVPLTRQDDYWVGATILDEAPPDGVYLRCEKTWQLQCGIGEYFLPQGRAADMGQALRDGAVATIRVDRFGHAALMRIDAD